MAPARPTPFDSWHAAVPAALFAGTALLTMLNSCANGITTVNIDNGYGAAYVATQINRLACGNRE